MQPTKEHPLKTEGIVWPEGFTDTEWLAGTGGIICTDGRIVGESESTATAASEAVITCLLSFIFPLITQLLFLVVAPSF